MESLQADYIYDEKRLEKLIAEFAVQIEALNQESEATTDLDLGAVGPGIAAARKAAQLEAYKDRLTAALEMVRRGFEFWEQSDFELAVECCGEIVTFSDLSMSLTSEYAIGNPECTIQMPMDVQGIHAKAQMSGRFQSFKIAVTFDTERQYSRTGQEIEVTVGPYQCYLFGTGLSKHLGSQDLFLVSSWSLANID